MSKNEFVPLLELAELSGLAPRTIYNQRHRGGHLASILTKFGGRVGCWRADWEQYKAAQRRLPAEGGNLSAPHAQAASITTLNTQHGTTNGKRNSGK